MKSRLHPKRGCPMIGFGNPESRIRVAQGSAAIRTWRCTSLAKTGYAEQRRTPKTHTRMEQDRTFKPAPADARFEVCSSKDSLVGFGLPWHTDGSWSGVRLCSCGVGKTRDHQVRCAWISVSGRRGLL